MKIFTDGVRNTVAAQK